MTLASSGSNPTVTSQASACDVRIRPMTLVRVVHGTRDGGRASKIHWARLAQRRASKPPGWLGGEGAQGYNDQVSRERLWLNAGLAGWAPWPRGAPGDAGRHPLTLPAAMEGLSRASFTLKSSFSITSPLQYMALSDRTAQPPG